MFVKWEFLDLPINEISDVVDSYFDICLGKEFNEHEFNKSSNSWKRIVLKYLKAAIDISELIKSGLCIVLQSGGSDYSTDIVLSVLVQLMLDPYFRTIQGIQINLLLINRFL